MNTCVRYWEAGGTKAVWKHSVFSQPSICFAERTPQSSFRNQIPKCIQTSVYLQRTNRVPVGRNSALNFSSTPPPTSNRHTSQPWEPAGWVTDCFSLRICQDSVTAMLSCNKVILCLFFGCWHTSPFCLTPLLSAKPSSQRQGSLGYKVGEYTKYRLVLVVNKDARTVWILESHSLIWPDF